MLYYWHSSLKDLGSLVAAYYYALCATAACLLLIADRAGGQFKAIPFAPGQQRPSRRLNIPAGKRSLKPRTHFSLQGDEVGLVQMAKIFCST